MATDDDDTPSLKLDKAKVAAKFIFIVLGLLLALAGIVVRFAIRSGAFSNLARDELEALALACYFAILVGLLMFGSAVAKK